MIMNAYFVKELFIYPIKSLAGIPVQSAKAQEMGFENDRRWMLIDEENQFITQRDHPNLSQFYPKIKEDKIEVTLRDAIHTFFIDETIGAPIFSKVWDDNCMVTEVNKTTSNWFSQALGFRCKLVKIGTSGDRKHKSATLNKSLNVSLADGYPYLLIGAASLDFLNQKLKEQIAIYRFRPNIVISSAIAHEEDFFDDFQIGKVKFKNAKPCSRCILVNHHPTTGMVSKEPLKTLSTYRNVDNSVFFGTNIFCIDRGIITIGDALRF
jgi:uncharacterized protein YcbX